MTSLPVFCFSTNNDSRRSIHL